MPTAVIAVIISAIGIILSLLGVAVALGKVLSKVETQGESLESHRRESAAANEKLGEEISAVRGDVGKIAERVARMEGAMPSLRAVR